MSMVETIREGEFDVLADFDNRARRAAVASGRRSAKILPEIDFAPFMRESTIGERRRVAEALRRACIDTGFFYLANHGIPEAELQLAHAWGRVFFEQPQSWKAQYDKNLSTAKQGWMPVGGTNPEANLDKAADLKETFVLAREPLPGETPGSSFSAGQSQWPDEEAMPGFKPFIQAHIRKRLAVAQALPRAFALSLDLPEDYFDPAHRYLNCSFTYNYYPPMDRETALRTQWGISPHTDYGSFTLLSQDALGGLEVRDAAGEWIDVPPREGRFVVNIADLFQRWTNGLYKSSLHRASNFSGAARISLPFFVIPQRDVMVECVPTCVGPGNPARYEPVRAETYVRTLLEQSYRTGRPGVAQQTVTERLKPL
jgi:isopenicillin N synthase-like dioxygenase